MVRRRRRPDRRRTRRMDYMDALEEHQDLDRLSIACVADGCQRTPCMEAGAEGYPLCQDHDERDYREAFDTWRKRMASQLNSKREHEAKQAIEEAPDPPVPDDHADVIRPPESRE